MGDAPAGVVVGDAPVGADDNGAPTAISQRWPGSPCAGFSGPWSPVFADVVPGTGVGIGWLP